MTKPFEAKGLVSQKAAAVEVFREIAEGEWIQADELAHKISEITQAECLDSYSAGWQAAQHLAANQEFAVAWYRGGWKRLRPDEQFSDVVNRGIKLRRSKRRFVRWVENALSNEAITGPDRHDLQVEHRTQLAQADIDARRAARRRPDPPAVTGT